MKGTEMANYISLSVQVMFKLLAFAMAMCVFFSFVFPPIPFELIPVVG